MLLTPVLMVLLLITVIGIAVVPFAALAIYVAILFGKAVMLAWIGGRFIRFFGHTAIAVLVGGVIVLGLYLVPVIGFIVYKLLGIVGFGVVIYTLLLKAKAARRVQALEAPAAHGVSSSDVPIDVSGVAGQATADMAAADPIAAASTMARAGFWIRMAALAIDAVLVGVVLSAFGDSDQTFLLVIAAYGAVMWKLKGTTVGGIVCGLQVVRLDGRAIDWPTAMVRALGCFLSLIVVGLGFLWIVFDDGKQSWHDKIAGTAVVRAPKGASLL
jgi:uncharacterized RDD family membrane protein YckC